MEDIRFFDAVRQGDILRLSSHVVWSDKDELQIQVWREYIIRHYLGMFECPWAVQIPTVSMLCLFSFQVEASSSPVGIPLKKTNRLVFYYKQVRSQQWLQCANARRSAPFYEIEAHAHVFFRRRIAKQWTRSTFRSTRKATANTCGFWRRGGERSKGNTQLSKLLRGRKGQPWAMPVRFP